MLSFHTAADCCPVGHACLDQATVERAPAADALERAARCLARDQVDGAFRDPYLSYVYPAENLPVASTIPGPRLTYRRVDADVVLALLARHGAPPEPLAAAVRQAEKTLKEIVPVWRDAGLDNVRRGARQGGVALDTFCIVGWLNQDDAMARVVADALDGDGWLPGALYDDGEERFRLAADESWCVRLLVTTHPGLGGAARVVDRIAGQLKRDAQADPGGRGVFYEAWHLAMALEKAGPAYADIRHRAVAVLRAWALLHEAATDEHAERRAADIMEWANLASGDVLDPVEDRALTLRVVQILLRSQSEDGCWRFPPDSTGRAESATSFLTLRAMLALASYGDEVWPITTSPGDAGVAAGVPPPAP
ncbi:MAG TPA: hypothetical protein VFE84_01875 [Patescibacteria group bacterium]|nr:hypothetical protein [Patescibacteria group bacterium]